MDFRLLQALGVGEKAAFLYLAGLSLGTTSVQELARKSGMKRPTVYLRLDELIKQGLFETIVIGKKTYYRAADPPAVEERLKKNLAVVQSELPKLAKLRSDTLGKPQVRLLEGEAGIRKVYEEMKTANSLRVWSNINPESFRLFNSTYMDMAEAIKQQGIGVREIIANTRESRRYTRLVRKVAGPTYNPRTATVEGLTDDAIIYGNVVALFRLSGLNQFVVRIEDPALADSLRALFEMAWKTARPFK